MNCIITGASRGLGKAIAEKFAAGGYNLYCCSRNAAALSATRDDLSARYPGLTIEARAFDLGKKDQARQFGQWVLDKGVTVDVLINNAGSRGGRRGACALPPSDRVAGNLRIGGHGGSVREFRGRSEGVLGV